MSIIKTMTGRNAKKHLFCNGIVLSIIWGAGSYTKYRGMSYEEEVPIDNADEFEIALMDGLTYSFIGRDLMPELFPGDDVRGYISIEELDGIINQIGQLKYVPVFSTKMVKILFNHYWADFRRIFRPKDYFNEA